MTVTRPAVGRVQGAKGTQGGHQQVQCIHVLCVPLQPGNASSPVATLAPLPPKPHQAFCGCCPPWTPTSLWPSPTTCGTTPYTPARAHRAAFPAPTTPPPYARWVVRHYCLLGHPCCAYNSEDAHTTRLVCRRIAWYPPRYTCSHHACNTELGGRRCGNALGLGGASTAITAKSARIACFVLPLAGLRILCL